MSRLQTLFELKQENVLAIYCTAGFPGLEDTIPVMEAIQVNGADIIELGIPYSDPLADGPVIQHSSARAIGNGMTVEVLFEQLRDMRKTISLPVVLMGYMNQVLQFGFERFCRKASSLGIDGLILPDLPALEFNEEYGAIIKSCGLDFIFLVTPETPDERVIMLDGLSSGFLYAVSSTSTTGSEGGEKDVASYLRRLRELRLKNPVLVGFGIRDKPSLAKASKDSRGVIVGSAYIEALRSGSNISDATTGFIKNILGR